MSTDAKPLLEVLEERFQKLRRKDGTVRKYEREIERHADAMRRSYHMRRLAKMAIRKQEEWLREEAAAKIRKELGIKTIPGFASRRESAMAFRMNLTEKHKAAAAAAKKILDGDTPVPPP